MMTVAQIMLSSDAFWLLVAAYLVCRVVDPRLSRVWSAAGMADNRDAS
jgi:hypothetical protein